MNIFKFLLVFWLKFYLFKLRILITYIIKSCLTVKNISYHIKNWVSLNINIIINNFLCFLILFLYLLKWSSDSKNNNLKLCNHTHDKRKLKFTILLCDYLIKIFCDLFVYAWIKSFKNHRDNKINDMIKTSNLIVFILESY